MKKLATVAALLALAALPALAVPQSAAAGGSCAAGVSASVCGTLEDCYVTGAVYLTMAAPADAVQFYQGCVAADQRYEPPTDPFSGREGQPRERPLANYESTFFPLLCVALRNTGNDSVCQISVSTSNAAVAPGNGSAPPRTPKQRARRHAGRRPAFTARGRHPPRIRR